MAKKNNTKKDIALSFERALQDVFAGLQLGEPKKRIRKAISRASKKVAAEVEHFIKQESKRMVKEKTRALKKIKNQKLKKPLKAAKSATQGKGSADQLS